MSPLPCRSEGSEQLLPTVRKKLKSTGFSRIFRTKNLRKGGPYGRIKNEYCLTVQRQALHHDAVAEATAAKSEKRRGLKLPPKEPLDPHVGNLKQVVKKKGETYETKEIKKADQFTTGRSNGHQHGASVGICDRNKAIQGVFSRYRLFEFG